MKHVFVFLTSLFFNVAFGNVTGLELARKVSAANDGFISETSSMKMILVDAHGNKISRKMSGKTLEINGDGDRGLMEFLTPADVRGTKMLTWSHLKGNDDQWLYMPSIRRVKRINSRSKSSSFMGSEFSYEDLTSQEVEKYTYKLLGEKNGKGSNKIFVLEKRPVKKSGYSKQIHYINENYNQAEKIEYYGRKGQLLKTATPSGFKEYTIKGKKIWRPSSITMENKITRKMSILVWETREFGQNLNPQLFNKRELR